MICIFKAIHYYLQMCFKIFQNKCIEIYEFDPTHFLSEPVLAMQACLKKKQKQNQTYLLMLMLLIVEKGIIGGICHVIHRFAKANNKYMKKYNKDNEQSYIMYLDANNLY